MRLRAADTLIARERNFAKRLELGRAAQFPSGKVYRIPEKAWVRVMRSTPSEDQQGETVEAEKKTREPRARAKRYVLRPDADDFEAVA